MWFNRHYNHPNDPDSGFAATFNPSNAPKPSLTSSVQMSYDNTALPVVVPSPDIVETVSETRSVSTPDGDTPDHTTNLTETHHSTICGREHGAPKDFGHSKVRA